MGGDWRGDRGGREFERVLDALRTRLTDGTYQVGNRLPPQRELAEERGGRAVTLGSLISEAFEQPEITLDVYTLTSESLDAHVRVQAERIRARGTAPQRIALRMLLPSEGLELPYPRAKDPAYNEDVRQRLLGITRQHTASLRRALRELRTEGLVPTVDIEIRHAPLVPTFKLYLFNGAEVLQGPYEVLMRRIELDSGEEIDTLDVLGFGATLTHYVKDDDPNSQGSVSVASMQSWFDSAWNLLAE